MKVVPLPAVELALVAAVMRTGRPWLPEHTDFWLWRECFGDTSFVALDGNRPAGGVLACVNQARTSDLYIDQVAVDPAWRGQGVTKQLLDAVEGEARKRRCTRLWLSIDPVNPAIRAWPPLGFTDLGMRKDFKGPGKDRALFEKRLA
jgi:GNAT superfamily N-acetyltransferase